MSMPAGGMQSSAGGGGPSGSTAGGSSGTGAKNFNIGGNPNITSGAMTPLIIGIVILGGLWYLAKKRK